MRAKWKLPTRNNRPRVHPHYGPSLVALALRCAPVSIHDRSRGEEHAARYLRHRGLKIIGRNVQNRFGELDIVARDRHSIIFVEVRTRSSTRRGTPAETIGPAKQRTLSRAALSYLKSHGLLDRPARFDVITLVWDESGQPADLKHIENAFSPVE